MNKSKEIQVIDIENSDLTTRGFQDCTNIQEDEYSERVDLFLERIQVESRRQENPKEKRRKLCDHLKSLFQVKLWFSRTHQGRPVTQVVCKATTEEKNNTSPATSPQSGPQRRADPSSMRSSCLGSRITSN